MLRRSLSLLATLGVVAAIVAGPLATPASAAVAGSLTVTPNPMSAGGTASLASSFSTTSPHNGNPHVVYFEILPVGSPTGSLTMGTPTTTGVTACTGGPTSWSCNLAGNGSGTFASTLAASGDAAGSWTVRLRYTNQHAAGVATTTIVTIAAPSDADLSIGKSADPGPVSPGDTITYTLDYANGGPVTVPDAEVVDTLPAGVTLDSVDTTGATPGTSCSGTTTITCTMDPLASGAGGQIVITATVQGTVAAGATLTNDAEISSATITDPDPSNNTDSATTAVASADLSVSKVVANAPGLVSGGDVVVFDVDFANAGPSDATGVQVVDTLPTGLSLVSVDTSAAPGASCSGTGTITCDLPDLSAGDGGTITITAAVDSDVVAGATLTNAVEVTSTTPDPDAGNNTDTAGVTAASADVRVTKSGDANPVVPGQTLTYTVAYFNDGPDAATNVVVVDDLPSGVTLVSVDTSLAPGMSCSGTTSISCGPVSLASGASGQIDIVVTVGGAVTPGSTLTNAALIRADEPDPDLSNNDSSVDTDVDAYADLSVSKSDSADPVVAGEQVVYTITYQNDGPSDATNVVITDSLPAEVTYVSDDGGCVPTIGTVISCDVGDVAAGAGGTIDVTVTVDADALPGTISNTVGISGSQFDPDTANNGATEDTDVTAEADLSILKVDTPDPVLPGADVTYTLTYQNDGPSDAVGVAVTDVLPAEVTYVSDDAGCVELVTNVLQCDVGLVPAGGGGTISVVATVDASTPGGLISNSAAVNSFTTDPDNANNTASAQTEVTATADLSITKADSPDPVLPGAQLTYTLTYRNDGPSPATGVSIIDVLPADVTFDSATPDQGSCSEVVGVVNCDIGDLPAGAGGQATIVVTVSGSAVPGTTITNNAAINAVTVDPDDANNTAQAVTTIQDEADLSIAKSDAPDPVTAGEQLTYTLTYDNLGPSDASNVIVTDVLPTGVTLSSVTPDAGSCDVLGGTITCTIGDVAVADPAGDIVVVVDIDPFAPDGSMLTNTVSISGAEVDQNPANNSTTANTTVTTSADVSLAKADTPDPVVAGEQLTYALTYANAGPSDAQTVSVVDGLPAGVTFVSATPDQGSCSEAGGTVTCDLGTLRVGTAGQIEVVVDVDPSTAPGTITNLATANPGTADPDFGNNSVSEGTSVIAVADLSITKTDALDPVFAGEQLVYTIEYANAGPSDATNAQVVDLLPAGVTFVAAVSDDGSCSESADTVTCDLGTLVPGALGEVTVVVDVPADAVAGSITNSVTIGSDASDPNPSDNSADESTDIDTSADLSVTKVASATEVRPGDRITYTITYANAGPSTAVDVVVTDTLPGSVVFVSASPDSGTCNETGGVVTCDVGDVAAGDSRVVLVTVEVSATAVSGPMANQVDVASATTDPTPGDNAATVEVLVLSAPTTPPTTEPTTPTTTPTTPTTTPEGGLPTTGTDTVPSLVMGIVLLFLGSVVIVSTRRSDRGIEEPGDGR